MPRPQPVRSGRSFTTIDYTGPFFEKDPTKTLRQNVRIMLEAMAREGESDVRAQIPSKSGDTAAGIHGRVKNLEGKPWAVTMVVSQQRVFPWKKRGARGFVGRGEAEYRGGKLEAKLHMFRRTSGRLSRSRAVNMAELTKGLN